MRVSSVIVFIVGGVTFEEAAKASALAASVVMLPSPPLPCPARTSVSYLLNSLPQIAAINAGTLALGGAAGPVTVAGSAVAPPPFRVVVGGTQVRRHRGKDIERT